MIRISKTLYSILALGFVTTLSGCDASKGVEENGDGQQAPDPVVVAAPMAFIERPIPMDEEGNPVAESALEPTAFNPGARLILKDRASTSAPERVITDQAFITATEDPMAEEMPAMEETEMMDVMRPMYDVKDVAVSYDGLKLVFAMRAPEIEDANDDEQPTWNIWEYDTDTEILRRIITSDNIAEAGHDIDPYYLPNGDIVFSSTRQPRSKAILLDENKPQFAPQTEDGDEQDTFVLHTMEADGTRIEQITYNQSHDLAPTVMDDGSILFLRWDNYVGGDHDRVSLYRTLPDGSNTSPYYGYHSQLTGSNDTEAAFIDPMQTQDGALLASLRARVSQSKGGDLVIIDGTNFTDINQNVSGSDTAGPAQNSIIPGRVTTDGTISPEGSFNSAYPLFDDTGRLLVSWSVCLADGIGEGVYVNTDGQLVNDRGILSDENGVRLEVGQQPVIPNAEDIGRYPCRPSLANATNVALSEPLYGIYLFDLMNDTQTSVILPKDDTMYTEAVLLEERDLPTFFTPQAQDEQTQTLANNGVGVVNIRSVYDFHGEDSSVTGIDALADPLQTPANERPARFVRILKAVSIPNEDVYDFDNSAFGRAGGQMKDILGYAPIEPDGSVRFQVPADVAFTFSILDANGRRVPGFLGERHQNWLTLRSGEVRQCGGCHARDNELPHGRLDAEAPSSYAGAAGSIAFANTLLLDSFGSPHIPPESGETMAEYYARVNGNRPLSVNIAFEDEWTDERITPKASAFSLDYSDLGSAAPPTSVDCQNNWRSTCRIVINYIDHIQPLWEVDRSLVDAGGMLIEDRTCTSCHSRTDAMDQAQVPAGQLELTNQPSDLRNGDFLTSYQELFFPDNQQELVEDQLLDIMVQRVDEDGNLVFQVDAEGNLILDADGNPIPVLDPVTQNAYMNPRGARDNQNFFNLFIPGGAHADYLNGAELKLLSEWLDIGGQYYNNPFDAPAN